MNDREILIIFPVIFLSLLTGCVGYYRDYPLSHTYILYKDNPLSSEETVWLKDGPQTRIGNDIRQARDKINGRNRRELLYKSVDYIRYHFRYDSWCLDRAFMFTANDIFKAGVMGGCSDFAVAEVALFRALGIPARLILTVNTDWISEYKTNDLVIPRGHVFIEVYLEKGWYLFDPVYRTLYQGYDPNVKSFPRKEYFVLRTRDFFDAGIKNLSDVIQIYQKFALNFNFKQYKSPYYEKIPVKSRFQWN